MQRQKQQNCSEGKDDIGFVGYETPIKNSSGMLPLIPVESLSDVDVLQKFVKR